MLGCLYGLLSQTRHICLKSAEYLNTHITLPQAEKNGLSQHALLREFQNQSATIIRALLDAHTLRLSRIELGQFVEDA